MSDWCDIMLENALQCRKERVNDLNVVDPFVDFPFLDESGNISVLSGKIQSGLMRERNLP